MQSAARRTHLEVFLATRAGARYGAGFIHQRQILYATLGTYLSDRRAALVAVHRLLNTFGYRGVAFDAFHM